MPTDPSASDKAVASAPRRESTIVAEELPVVARLVVEVRSDGRRTIARGAMEDAATGTTAAIEAAGTTPLELALGLAKNLLSAPWFARQVARSGIRALLRKP